MVVSNKTLLMVFPLLVIAFNNCAPMESNLENSMSSEIAPESIVNDELYNLGKSLYGQNCAGCHGSLELSSKRGINLQRLNFGRQNVPNMRRALSGKNINFEAIIYALNNDAPTGEPANLISSNNPKYTCEYPGNRGLNHAVARRLTRIELENTISDIFGEKVVEESEAQLGLYPLDHFEESISEFNPNMNSQLVSALLAISEKVAVVITTPGPIREQFFPACMINQYKNINFDNTQCRDQFVRDLGMKILRRPLTEQQYQVFQEILASDKSFHKYNRDKLSSLIGAMMLTPEFTHHISQHERSSGGKSQVDSYTLAARISYTSAGTLPDDSLFRAAQMNQLGSIQERKKHSARLINTQSGREYVRQVFGQYLKIDHIERQPASAYGAAIGIKGEDLVEDLKEEALLFVDHHVFNKKSGFEELMTSTEAHPVSQNSGKIFGLNNGEFNGSPRPTNSGHAGLFTRPVLLYSTSLRTSPIVRGIKFTRNVLCTEIPEPDPELLAQAEMSLAEIDEQLNSARQIAEHMTSGQACQVCHKHINPPGYILENFGAFGEKRTREIVFNPQGMQERTLAIDSDVQNFLIDNQSVDLSSAGQFMATVAQSTQGKACFAENLFKNLNLRDYDANDGCQLSEIEGMIREGQSIQEVIIHNATGEDQLWEKTN